MRKIYGLGASWAGLFLFVLSVNSFALEGALFPIMPDPQMTPGALCQNPSEYRYPERIAYCRRSVSRSTKNRVIEQYDETFGYSIRSLPRGEFKIDHYIPLCMGGSNDISNLWPQHRSVYIQTDQLEQQLCEKMARGELSQAEAINMIKKAKASVSQCQKMLQAS